MDAVISPGMVAFEGFRYRCRAPTVCLRPDCHREWGAGRGWFACTRRPECCPAAATRGAGDERCHHAAGLAGHRGRGKQSDSADHGAAQNSRRRAALDSCIQTVTGRGYRFVAAVARLAADLRREREPARRVPGIPNRQTKLPSATRGSACPPRGTVSPQLTIVSIRVRSVAEWQEPPRGKSGGTRRQAVFEPRPSERRQLTVMACDVVGLAGLSLRLDLEDRRCGDYRLSPVLRGYHRTASWLRHRLLD